MHIKQAYDEMINAKNELDKRLCELILEMDKADALSGKSLIDLHNELRELTNNIVRPFTE